MNVIPARIGDSIDEIDTPALIVDLDAFEHNIHKLANFSRSAGVRLRPHAKTHKCPTIALKQIAAVSVGQCCQKVGEAEALVRGGVRDVLVSNEVIGVTKLRRLAALAADAAIGLCFDATEQVDAASRVATEVGVEIGAMVEIEVGMQRCGVAAGKAASDLARYIGDAPGLRFSGLQAYYGTARSEEHTSELQSPYDLVCRLLLEKKKKKGKGNEGAILKNRCAGEDHEVRGG